MTDGIMSVLFILCVIAYGAIIAPIWYAIFCWACNVNREK